MSVQKVSTIIFLPPPATHCKRMMMLYMAMVMIEVAWESSVPKVSNMQIIWGGMISVLQGWCANLWINNLQKLVWMCLVETQWSFTISWLSLVKLLKRKLKTNIESSHDWSNIPLGKWRRWSKFVFRFLQRKDMKLESRWCPSCIEIHPVIAAYCKEISSSHRVDKEMLKHIKYFIIFNSNIMQMQMLNILSTPNSMCMLLSKL